MTAVVVPSAPAARWRWFAAWVGVGLLVPLTILGAFLLAGGLLFRRQRSQEGGDGARSGA
jgi:hypothetical protein